MKKLIFALVVSCTALMQAQNTVSGKITDANNKTLSGVSVYIQELQKGTLSKPDGTYSLTNVPKGTISISYALAGYGTQHKTVTDSQKQRIINVQLAAAVLKWTKLLSLLLSINYNRKM